MRDGISWASTDRCLRDGVDGIPGSVSPGETRALPLDGRVEVMTGDRDTAWTQDHEEGFKAGVEAVQEDRAAAVRLAQILRSGPADEYVAGFLRGVDEEALGKGK